MRFGKIIGCLVWFSLFAGCANPAQPQEPKTLKIGVLPITDVVPAYVAQEQGYYAAEGIDVELVPVASGVERDSLIQAGGIDGGLNELLTTVLINAGSEAQVRVVTTARRVFPDVPLFFVLASPGSGITTVEQLKGVEIGISENTVIEYVTDRTLQRAGLQPGEIRFTNVPAIPVRLELLLNDQLKAAVLPDPLASLARLQGARIVVSDAVYPEVSLSAISFRQAVLEDRPNTVRAFLRAWDRAVADINADPRKFRNVLIQKARVPEPLQDRYDLPPFPQGELPNQAQVQDVVDWALEKGLIQEPLSYDEVVAAEFRR